MSDATNEMPLKLWEVHSTALIVHKTYVTARTRQLLRWTTGQSLSQANGQIFQL